MIRKLTAGAIAAALVTGAAANAQAKKLEFATQAPKRSPWGKVFTAWSKAIEKKTDSEIVWHWNGTQGAEKGVIGKIKSGQLHGAAVTAVGLSQIHKPILGLQVPGTFSSWSKLDRARKKLTPEFESAMKKEGFNPLGWGDVGIGRVFSKDFAVKAPTDLRGHKPAMLADDIIAPKVYEVIGGVQGVPSSITGFLPKLNSGAIDVMNTPALAGEQLQWLPRLTHMNTAKTYFSIGAVVISQDALESLPKDDREYIEKSGQKAAAALTKRIRRYDQRAYRRARKKMTVHRPSAAEKAEWKKVFKDACGRLKGAIPGDTLTKIGAC